MSRSSVSAPLSSISVKEDTSTSHCSHTPVVAFPIPITPETVTSLTSDLSFEARQALHRASQLKKGRLTIFIPEGRKYIVQGTEPGTDATIHIHDWRMAEALNEQGDIGFAESYVRGEWDTPDLTAFITLFAENYRLVQTLLAGRPLVRLWQVWQHWRKRNTKKGSKRNIYAHYDLGNAFYQEWLDPSLTYSSALFDTENQSLEAAQHNKYARLAQELQLRPEHHVLEIGCGWGGFMEYAAKHIGCRVTGVTISKEQHRFAVERLAAQDLSAKTEVRLQDYRDVSGTFDHVVSIEMFEAVGEKYWETFFKKVASVLKPQGRAALQVITICEENFLNYRREMDFIRHAIFPGGMLPSKERLVDSAQKSPLTFLKEHNFGLDYAKTLEVWRETFHAAWDKIHPLGFDEAFRRTWNYYLCYCEAGFRSKNIDVRHVVFQKA
jgi:cyclopropane-fatty-acyl-phospholipid synthase